MAFSYLNNEGGDSWECGGGPDATARGFSQGITCSADNIRMKLSQAEVIKPTGWALGRSKFMVNSWEQKMKFVNISNQPLTITFYTLKTRTEIPYDLLALNLSGINSLLNIIEQLYGQQYNQAPITNFNRTVNHPAFKLTDLAVFQKYFKIVKVTNIKLMPGGVKVMKKFRNKPQVINTAGLMNTGTSPTAVDTNIGALKGERHYLWRNNSFMVENEGDGNRSRIAPAYSFETTYHYRMSFLAGDEYTGQIAAIPHIGDANYRVIYPGTSTKGALLPAA